MSPFYQKPYKFHKIINIMTEHFQEEYHQDLIDMLHHIDDLNIYLFQTKVRKDNLDAFSEKRKIYPSLEMLKATNYIYNLDEEKYSFTIGLTDGIRDIHFDDYATFEEIIKQINEDESKISLEEIDTAQSINSDWLKKVSEQKEIYDTFFENARKNYLNS